MSNEIIKNLDEKIEAMEKEIFGSGDNREDDVSETSPVSAESTESHEPSSDTETASEIAADSVNTHQEEDWEKRFKNLKRHHDTKVYELRRTIAHLTEKNLSLEEEIDKLRQEMSELKAQSQEDLKSIIGENDEFLEIVGDDGAKSITKLVENATKPLIEEVNRLKQELRAEKKKSVEDMVAQQKRRFLDALGSLVEDYEEINVDPKFIEYLNEPDPVSGRIRFELFKIAERAGDAKRVAEFFLDFKKEHMKPQEVLTQHVAPEASTASTNDSIRDTADDKPIYTMADYRKFMTDITKGKYRGKKDLLEKMEREFNLAFKEGRVR